MWSPLTPVQSATELVTKMDLGHNDEDQRWIDDDIDFDFANDRPTTHNPPPKDLPDLLDELILSEEALGKKIGLCDKLAQDLITRIAVVKRKLEALRAKHPEWLTRQEPSNNATRKGKVQIAFEQQVTLLSHMLIQLQFLHFLASQNLRDIVVECVRAHRRLFEAFLGERHAHAGIEVANASLEHCIEGCPFYYLNGSHEWTKRPYSQKWVDEMTCSDWSWSAVHQEIEDVLRTGRAEISPKIDLFHAHLKRMVPCWFWINDPQPWSLQARVSKRVDAQGRQIERVETVVRFKKPSALIEKERATKLAQIRQVQETGVDSAGADAEETIVIDPEAVQEVNPSVALDGQVLVRNWTDGAADEPVPSWLDYWGFEAWIKSVRRKT